MGLIAAVQMTSNNKVSENLAAVVKWVSQAAILGAQVVVLPENVALMGKNESDKFAIAEEPFKGPIQDKLREIAVQNNVWIVAGTIPIKISELGITKSGNPESGISEQKVASTSWVYNNKGETIARYDKIHLFDVKVRPGQEEYQESKTVFPGNKIVCVDSPVGKLGLSICYDLRFPELYRKLLDEGAEILLVPSAFTQITGEAHWEVLLRARAIENVCYIVAAAQVGTHPSGRKTFGHSMIVDPWGTVIAEDKDGEGLIMTDIDLEYLKKTRERLPIVLHRRIRG